MERMVWLNLDEKGPRGIRQVPLGKSRNKCGRKTSVATVLSCKQVIAVGREGEEEKVVHSGSFMPATLTLAYVNTSI